MMPLYKIYALVNPSTGLPFYIGATKQNIYVRLICHLNDHRRKNHGHKKYTSRFQLHEYLSEILDSKNSPRVKLLCLVDETSVERIERYIYYVFSDLGVKLFQSERFSYKRSYIDSKNSIDNQ